MEVHDDQQLVAGPSLASNDIDGEVVVLNLADGRYYGLNGVAGQVWHWVQEPRSPGELVELLVAEFEVDRAQAGRDLDVLLDDLLARELIVVAT
jgi:hypothetical protein